MLHEELSRVVLSGLPLADVLGEITTITRRAMPGAEASSITLIRNEDPFTAAHDGQMALDADELQYQRDYGPCVDAGRSGLLFLVEDMRLEQRWPDYAKHAAQRGVGSSLSIPLPFQAATIGALNNYSTKSGSFGTDDVAVGEEVASWVALAVATASAGEEAANLQIAMASRAAVEQAKGILMERHRFSTDQAFNLLTQTSQRTGLPLRDVAHHLIRTGTLPGTD